MTNSNRFKRLLGIFMIAFLAIHVSEAQTYRVNNSASEVKIEGTSNLHDWEMNAEELKGSLQASFENNHLVRLDKLNFAVVSESLKSGKGGMDKNAYKALDTKKHKEMRFQLKEIKKIDCDSDSTCEISLRGNLSIGGTSKPIDIEIMGKTTQNSIVLTGEHQIKMTQYNVDPPTAMFGAVTTGDDLKITFKVEYKK